MTREIREPKHEFVGITRCPFCGREKSETEITCSRPSCEGDYLDYLRGDKTKRQMLDELDS